jgi:hypothetical protein
LQKKRGIYFDEVIVDANLDIIDDESSENSAFSDNDNKNDAKKQEGEITTTNITLPF